MSLEETAIDPVKDVNMLKMNFIGFIILLMACLIAAGCNNSQASNTSVQSKHSQNTPKKASFNPSDKSIESNGYMTIAVNKINGMGSKSVWEESIPVTAEALTKSPYSALGKPHKISGEVYKIEEFPPIGGLQGHWSEILLLAENPNSLLGLTTIDFMYKGDISKIKSGQSITCAGFFVGTFQSENTLGGKDETFVLVGNDLRYPVGVDLASEQSQSQTFIAHVASWKTASKAEKHSKLSRNCLMFLGRSTVFLFNFSSFNKNFQNLQRILRFQTCFCRYSIIKEFGFQKFAKHSKYNGS